MMTDPTFTADVALAGRLPVASLPGLLGAVASHLRFLFLEGPQLTDLLPFSTDAPIERADAGCAFGPQCTVRWRTSHGESRVMVIGTELPAELSLPHRLELGSDCDVEQVTYPLWGERDEAGNGWREERIPRLLQYPVEQQSARVLLDVLRYRSRETGAIVASRYVGVRGEGA